MIHIYYTQIQRGGMENGIWLIRSRGASEQRFSEINKGIIHEHGKKARDIVVTEAFREILAAGHRNENACENIYVLAEYTSLPTIILSLITNMSLVDESLRPSLNIVINPQTSDEKIQELQQKIDHLQPPEQKIPVNFRKI